MEYSESIIQGPTIEWSACNRCGSNTYNTQGVLKYGFFFLEYLPFIPTGKAVEIHCQHCQAKLADSELPASKVSFISHSIFSIRHYLSKFIGLAIFVLLVAMLLANYLQKETKTDNLIASPKVNDFLIMDYRKLTDEFRPNQNYFIAKVADITGDVVSLVYGNYFYVRHGYAEKNLAMGRTTHFDYFQSKRRDFTFEEYSSLRKSGAIVQAERPDGTMLFGNNVIELGALPKANALVPGSIENVKGLAYQRATYVENYLETAKEYLTISAEQGYKYGQINLANLYLIEQSSFYNKEKALYWYKQAALQDSQSAIDKYISLCKSTAPCDNSSFYQELRNNGVNFSYR